MNERILLCISFLFLFFSTLSGAKKGDTNPIKNISTETIQEDIVLFTDRSIYSSNEQIYFSAKYFTSKKLPSGKCWSTVLYLELIAPDGTALVQNKYPLSISGSSGYIHIPEEIRSGVYYLKAYTKWMRNFPTSIYSYSRLKLINPDNSELLSYSDLKSDMVLQEQIPTKDTNLVLTTNKNKYTTREKVNVSFQKSSMDPSIDNYTITVVRKGTKSISVLESQNTEKEASTPALYLPEINGITLSGKIVNPSGESVEDTKTRLSRLNDQCYFSNFTTNNKGEFFFSFPPLSNTQDFYIEAIKDDLSLNINLVNEFCSRPVYLENIPFELNLEEQVLAEEICVNAKISEVFKKVDTIVNSESLIEHSFYGTPKRVLYMKDYIDLPYIEEFISELIPEVVISYKRKVPNIKPESQHPLFDVQFLTMVDNIPIIDLSEFLKIRTNNVDRIEIIDKGYVIGNNKYSGILNAFTKKKDLSGIDLPQNSMFFNYLMFAEQDKTTSVEYNNIIGQKSRIPDFRNCLYWNPKFTMDKNDTSSLSFFTSDVKGDYQIIVQTISKNGSKLVFADTEFSVE